MPHYLDIMGRSRPARFVAALALVCFVVGSTTRDALAAPPRYVATDLGSFPNSTVPLSPNAINDYGQVVFDNGFLWTPTAPNATTGTLTHPGDPFATPGSMTPEGINSRGQVAITVRGGGRDAAVLWSPDVPNGMTGSFTVLATTELGSVEGINDFGQVVGRFGTGNLWTPQIANGTVGTVTNLHTSASTGLDVALDINSFGQVVGARGERAVLWTPNAPNGAEGTAVDITGRPSAREHARVINSAGQVVINGRLDPSSIAFLWTPTTPNATTGLSIPANSASFPQSEWWGINDAGRVVGGHFTWTSQDGTHRLASLIDTRGWSDVAGIDINNMGQIIGEGLYDPDGGGPLAPRTRAVLLTPVPEPSALLLLAGAPALVLRRLRSAAPANREDH